jgi:hypothetical protein
VKRTSDAIKLIREKKIEMFENIPPQRKKNICEKIKKGVLKWLV